VQAFKKFSISRAPKILVVHLKRFAYRGHIRERINEVVKFPLKDLNIEEFVEEKTGEPLCYDLYAISNHFGSLGGGHYNAFVRGRNDTSKWYRCDDSNVSDIDEKDLVTSAAYVLFYIRKDVEWPAFNSSKSKKKDKDESDDETKNEIEKEEEKVVENEYEEEEDQNIEEIVAQIMKEKEDKKKAKAKKEEEEKLINHCFSDCDEDENTLNLTLPVGVDDETNTSIDLPVNDEYNATTETNLLGDGEDPLETNAMLINNEGENSLLPGNNGDLNEREANAMFDLYGLSLL
jgi:hypothetical protein